MTYNIHSGVGSDKRYDLGRIRRVLNDERPDIAALQELECRSGRTSHDDQANILANDLVLKSFFCATRPAEEGSFGIAVMSAFPVLHQQQYDLSYQTHREPRYCLRVDLEVEAGAVLHVFNCHLGLGTRERAFQRTQMVSDAILLSEELHHPIVLMGDFNDRPISVVHRILRQHFTDAFTAAGKHWGPTSPPDRNGEGMSSAPGYWESSRICGQSPNTAISHSATSASRLVRSHFRELRPINRPRPGWSRRDGREFRCWLAGMRGRVPSRHASASSCCGRSAIGPHHTDGIAARIEQFSAERVRLNQHLLT
jgi:endonuclease/exonuclease/phosphatase family metal-dependent hydrolase